MGQRTCTVYVLGSILLGTRKMRGGWCCGFLPAHTLSATILNHQMPPKIPSGWIPQIEPRIRRALSGIASRHRTIEVTESMLRSLLPLVTQKVRQRIRLRSESVWFIYLYCVNGVSSLRGSAWATVPTAASCSDFYLAGFKIYCLLGFQHSISHVYLLTIRCIFYPDSLMSLVSTFRGTESASLTSRGHCCTIEVAPTRFNLHGSLVYTWFLAVVSLLICDITHKTLGWR